MTIPFGTFPVPDAEGDMNALADSLNAVTQGHMAVLGGLQSGLIQHLTPIQQGYDDTERQILQAANRAGRTADRTLSNVVGAVGDHASNVASEVNVSYNAATEPFGSAMKPTPQLLAAPQAAPQAPPQVPMQAPPLAAPVPAGPSATGASASTMPTIGDWACVTLDFIYSMNPAWTTDPSDMASNTALYRYGSDPKIDAGFDAAYRVMPPLPGTWFPRKSDIDFCLDKSGPTKPTPPPTPPPTPQPPQPSVAPVAVETSVAPPAQPSEPASCPDVAVHPMVTPPESPWYTVAGVVYDELVMIGRQLLECEGDGLGQLSIEILSKYWFRDPDASWPSNGKADLDSVLRRNSRPEWWKNARSAALAWPGSAGTDVLCLSALRAVLESARELVVHWGEAGQWGTSKGWGFGAGVEIADYHQGEHAQLHDHIAVAKALRPIVVFQIEVVDRCLIRARGGEKPKLPEAMDALLMGQMSYNQYTQVADWNGASAKDWEPILRARSEHLMSHEVIQWCRRNGMDRQATLDTLSRYGWYREGERVKREELYDVLPTISDHLHWLQRNADDAEYVAQYNLLDGFAPDAQIRQLPGMADYVTRFNPTNRDFWAKFGKDLHAQGMKKEYAALHYAAHWILPPLGTMLEMTRRLRPGRVAKEVEFTEADLFRLMGEQDIAPWFRNRIRAINYMPFGLRFLTQFARTQVEGEAALVQRFQDIGYSASDAAIAVKSQMVMAKRANATSLSAGSPANLKKLYMAGRIGKFGATLDLQYLEYPQEAIDRALNIWDLLKEHDVKEAGEKEATSATRKAILDSYRIGIVGYEDATAQLVRTGYVAKHAQTILRTVDVSVKGGVVKQGITAIRKGVMSGRIAIPDAVSQLESIGLTQPRIAEYTSVWSIELQAGRRQLAAGKIIQLAKEGLLDAGAANERLVTLGYDRPDAMLLMAEAMQAEIATETKLATAEQRRSEAAAKQIVAMQQRIAAQAARAQAALAKVTPRATIMRWFGDGVVSERFVRERLAAMGIPASDVEADILDTMERRKKVVNVQATKTTTGPFGFKTKTTVG